MGQKRRRRRRFWGDAALFWFTKYLGIWFG